VWAGAGVGVSLCVQARAEGIVSVCTVLFWLAPSYVRGGITPEANTQKTDSRTLPEQDAAKTSQREL
jgi:hypothetical protein